MAISPSAACHTRDYISCKQYNAVKYLLHHVHLVDLSVNSDSSSTSSFVFHTSTITVRNKSLALGTGHNVVRYITGSAHRCDNLEGKQIYTMHTHVYKLRSTQLQQTPVRCSSSSCVHFPIIITRCRCRLQKYNLNQLIQGLQHIQCCHNSYNNLAPKHLRHLYHFVTCQHQPCMCLFA